MQKQRQRYDMLVRRHLWDSAPLDNNALSDSTKGSSVQRSTNSTGVTKRTRTIVTSTLSKVDKTQAIDPLSMMASMEEEQAMIDDKAREKEQKREQALASRSRSLNEKQVPKTRWNDFCTSKEN